MNYIFVNGYGCTGSSAIVDYLKEFSNVIIPAAEKEFRLIKDPYGIIDLDRSLNQSIDPLNEDIAIKKFIWMSNKYINRPGRFTDVKCGYLDDFGENIQIQTNQYVKALINRSYNGYWWYMDMDQTAIKMTAKRTLRKLGLKDFETYEKINLYTLTEEEFINLTRKYIYNIFSPFVKDENNTFIVLDNAIPPTHPSYADRYFTTYKMINVERDPRDIYVNLSQKKLLIGYYSSKTHDPSLFVDWYLKMRKNQESSPNVMTVWFEDFVINYDKTCEKICSFLSLDPRMNEKQQVFFNPDISIKDIGLWKKYSYKDEINYITDKLQDYLYQQ